MGWHRVQLSSRVRWAAEGVTCGNHTGRKRECMLHYLRAVSYRIAVTPPDMRLYQTCDCVRPVTPPDL